jgi:hypothetical protein
VSGKPHAPADVPTRYKLKKGLRGAYSKSRRLGEEKQFLPLARFKTRTVHPAAYGTPAPINTRIYLDITFKFQDSSDCTATGYGLDGPGIESR